MVVMEYIEGEMLQVAMRKIGLETVITQIERAVNPLHENDLVFGGLRSPNIMITKTNEVKLIDFDWAGVHGQARYPPTISREIGWPPGVGPLSAMYKSHDDVLLGRLKDLKKRFKSLP
ncbi:hypothetical protein AX17_007095 [Amanita inopinata Kibby_2008]|nr:hypothetical protein AX17_007095 [Amanita inopinata Kibby_2008]